MKRSKPSKEKDVKKSSNSSNEVIDLLSQEDSPWGSKTTSKEEVEDADAEVAQQQPPRKKQKIKESK